MKDLQDRLPIRPPSTFASSIFKESLNSTNDHAMRCLREGWPTPLLVASGQQTAGRGQGSHVWNSQQLGNLYLSVGVNVGLSPQLVRPLNLYAILGLIDRLREHFNTQAIYLKQPNDVVARGVDKQWRKLGGCLSESTIQQKVTQHWVLGLGLNRKREKACFDPQVWEKSLSLSEIGLHISLKDLLRLCADSILNSLQTYSKRPELCQSQLPRLLKQYAVTKLR